MIFSPIFVFLKFQTFESKTPFKKYIRFLIKLIKPQQIEKIEILLSITQFNSFYQKS